MASTERASPLAAWPARFAAASVSATDFTIRELPFTTQINVRGNAADAAFAAATQAVLGHGLPAAANTWAGTAERAALWLGPDEWLVVAPDGMNESIVAALRNSLDGQHAAVTDVSANRTVIEIAGSHARAVLGKGCPLDLHARAFSPPQTAQSLLAKAQILLQCADIRPAFRLYVRISFAPYVAEWLIDAATEFAASRGLDAQRIAARLA